MTVGETEEEGGCSSLRYSNMYALFKPDTTVGGLEGVDEEDDADDADDEDDEDINGAFPSEPASRLACVVGLE